MSASPVLLLHITGGTLGLLSGAVAISLRKGSHRHGVAGNVFVLAMLCLAATGAYMSALKLQPGNILVGVLTAYLVTTSWRTARRRDGKPTIFDRGALLVVSLLAAAAFTMGVQAAIDPTGMKYGYEPGPSFVIGSIALLSAIGDIRLLVRGGIAGTQRIARHLWRMSFALFVASASIFLTRPHLFPVILRKTGVLTLLGMLPLVLMVFWLIRIRMTNTNSSKSLPQHAHAAA